MFDQIIIALYLTLTLIIGLLAGKKTKTFRDFAIGKRNFSTLVLLAAIFASLVEASETLDLAQEVTTEGLLYCISYLGAAFGPLTLAVFIVPKFGRFLGRSLSTGDIMEKLFGLRAKTLMGISTFFEMVLLAGAQILAISFAAQHFFAIPGDIAAAVVSLITLAYYLKGGARSVNATDVFQFGIIIVAIPILCGFALMKVGGYSTLISMIETKGLNFTAKEPASYGECAAIFVTFALPGLFPLMIQRMLMARNTAQLKRALILNAIIGTPFRIIIITLGLISFILLPEVAPEFALLEITSHLLPSGIKGIAIVGLLAVLMSTIDSALHLGSVAFTQDLVGSLLTKPLNDEKKLKLARYAAVLMTFGAVLIAINFNSIGGIFYLLLAIGNSVIWPGLLLGLTEINTSKKGFWIGALAGLSTVIFCTFVTDFHILYGNLLALASNILAHLTYVAITGQTKFRLNSPLTYFRLKIQTSNPLEYFCSISFVKNQDYCNIFIICSIFLSIYPFFVFPEIDMGPSAYVFLFINSLIAVLSFTLLFVELWYPVFRNTFPKFWGIVLGLALPTQTYFMIFQSAFSPIWVLDAVIIIPVLLTLTTKRAAIMLNSIGTIVALLLSLSIGFSPSLIVSNFGYWALLMHVLVLTLCLAIFRKRDVEMCRFATSTLLHETKRALSTFENAALYYKKRLPTLISNYKATLLPNETHITASELSMMISMPAEIQDLSQRTRTFLTNYFNRISAYSNGKIHKKNCSIKNCIKVAISDSSFSPTIKDLVCFRPESDLVVKGDREQLIQVFINILENAGHAIDSENDPRIDIEIIGQTVFITDNGKGIHSADIPNIFDEFFTTKSTSGQGLAFCKRAMIEHGGSILCTSQKDMYTKFELRFPQAIERRFI